jgi:hypothetical protein
MNPLKLAKVRAGRRRREQGAAMFLVAMTMAVLASVGIYALSAASLEVRTSGNERQNTQTHYLAEYGVVGAMHELTSTMAAQTMGYMLKTPDVCVSLPGVSASNDFVTRACRRLADTELGQQWTPGAITVPYASTTPLAPGTIAPGSFGAIPMAGHFFVELTDPVDLTPPSRYSMDQGWRFIQLTITSTGMTQPYQALTDPVAQYSGEGVEMQRARIIAGPIRLGTPQ